MDRVIKNSKFLSLVLRHRPDVIKLTLDEAGWALIGDLLAGCANSGKQMSLGDIKEAVQFNNKKRFEVSGDIENLSAADFIRACQGHSIPVNLGLHTAVPPLPLFHGTTSVAWQKIRQAGLKPMARHAVHLSSSLETATQVGNRHLKSGATLVILQVDTESMVREGYKFQVSANGVWLVDHVPAKFLSVVGQPR
jgi:putative RNA 2'-phosphotransferase